MAGLQRDDPELRAPIEHLEGRGSTVPRAFSRALPTFAIRRGVLYKKYFGTSNSPWLLVVPTSLREEIFQACHDDPTSGHLGYSRTLAQIREKYYWPKLPKTVHLYTRSCHECQRRKKPPSKPAGLLQPITPPTKPFQQIGMDLLGPFPPSTMGNRWIIVATDYLTRYAETKALPSGTAVEVAKFFIESIVLRHGAPEVLITDRGSSFMAQLTQEILRLSHTDHRRTTAYHPQTNGLTERLNKTIADMISIYAFSPWKLAFRPHLRKPCRYLHQLRQRTGKAISRISNDYAFTSSASGNKGRLTQQDGYKSNNRTRITRGLALEGCPAHPYVFCRYAFSPWKRAFRPHLRKPCRYLHQLRQRTGKAISRISNDYAFTSSASGNKGRLTQQDGYKSNNRPRITRGLALEGCPAHPYVFCRYAFSPWKRAFRPHLRKPCRYLHQLRQRTGKAISRISNDYAFTSSASGNKGRLTQQDGYKSNNRPRITRGLALEGCPAHPYVFCRYAFSPWKRAFRPHLRKPCRNLHQLRQRTGKAISRISNDYAFTSSASGNKGRLTQQDGYKSNNRPRITRGLALEGCPAHPYVFCRYAFSPWKRAFRPHLRKPCRNLHQLRQRTGKAISRISNDYSFTSSASGNKGRLTQQDGYKSNNRPRITRGLALEGCPAHPYVFCRYAFSPWKRAFRPHLRKPCRYLHQLRQRTGKAISRISNDYAFTSSASGNKGRLTQQDGYKSNNRPRITRGLALEGCPAHPYVFCRYAFSPWKRAFRPHLRKPCRYLHQLRQRTGKAISRISNDYAFTSSASGNKGRLTQQDGYKSNNHPPITRGLALEGFPAHPYVFCSSDAYSGFEFLSKRILAAAVLPSDGQSAEPRPDNSPGAPVKAGVWRVASPRTPSPAGGACTLGARCLVSSVTTDPSHVGHHTRTQGAPTGRCLVSGVTTNPEPCGFAHPRLAVRGVPVSGEKGTLVVELSPGYVWTLRGPPGEAIHRFGPCFS
ncbi:DDE-type integrase/transposase/recombinase [Ixodes scapularis]